MAPATTVVSEGVGAALVVGALLDDDTLALVDRTGAGALDDGAALDDRAADRVGLADFDGLRDFDELDECVDATTAACDVRRCAAVVLGALGWVVVLVVVEVSAGELGEPLSRRNPAPAMRAANATAASSSVTPRRPRRPSRSYGSSFHGA